jgi:hypothetical protein
MVDARVDGHGAVWDPRSFFLPLALHVVGGRHDGGVFDTVLALILKSYNMIAIPSRRTDRLASLCLTRRWVLSVQR